MSIKDKTGHLDPNHTAEAIDKIAKTVNLTDELEKQMVFQMNSAPLSRHHTRSKNNKDFEIVLHELVEMQVFHFIDRRDSYFGRTGGNYFTLFNRGSFIEYLNENKKKYSQNKFFHMLCYS